MAYSWLEKCLIIYLDVNYQEKDSDWNFIYKEYPNISRLREILEAGGNPVLAFSRGNILYYLFFSLLLGLFPKMKIRKTLYFNDDSLSKLIDSDAQDVYKKLSGSHSSDQNNFGLKYLAARIKRRVFLSLPLVVRAKYRLISFVNSENTHNLPLLNCAFIPSLDGKIFLANSTALIHGDLKLYKTTANPSYFSIIKNEYETMQFVSHQTENTNLSPKVFETINLNGRIFYQEEFVEGEPLAQILRGLISRNDTVAICQWIDRLNHWYDEYLACYSAEAKISLKKLYAPVFEEYYSLYGQDSEKCSLARSLENKLEELDRNHPGLPPVLTHNDLWPANFLVTEKGLVAIDWERATPGRAYFFDYFWMIISATFEYIGVQIKSEELTLRYQTFLSSQDAVCCHARKQLKDRLRLSDIPLEYMDLFLSIFLLELSIHGWKVHGGQMELNKFAAAEFHRFALTLDFEHIALAKSGQGFS